MNKKDGKVRESVGIFFGKIMSSKTFKTMVPTSRSRCMLISAASTDRPPGVQTTMGGYEPSRGGAQDILANHTRSRIVGAYGVAHYGRIWLILNNQRSRCNYIYSLFDMIFGINIILTCHIFVVNEQKCLHNVKWSLSIPN